MDVRPGQGGNQKLHLGWQGCTRARQSQVGHVDVPGNPRGTWNHRPKDLVRGPTGQAAGQRTRLERRALEELVKHKADQARLPVHGKRPNTPDINWLFVESIVDVPPSSLCDPKRVQRVGFAELVRNLVPFPSSNTKRGRGVVLEAPGLDWEEIKLFGHEPASKTNTSWLEVILHAFGVGTSHGLTRTHMTHHSPDSREATTFPPYSILCSSVRRLHPNGSFSWDSQGGVPKLSRFGLPGLWAAITSRTEFGSRRGLNQSRSSPRELSNAMSHTIIGRWKKVAVGRYELPKSRDSNRDNFGTVSGLQLGSPGRKSHLDVALAESYREYYKGEGGGFPQVRAVVSLVCPIACGLSQHPRVFPSAN